MLLIGAELEGGANGEATFTCLVFNEFLSEVIDNELPTASLFLEKEVLFASLDPSWSLSAKFKSSLISQ
jgi:hypothetical protein